MNQNQKNNLVIFASGAGSNTQKIIDYFKENQRAKIVLIVSNNKKAGVLQIAAKENIPSLIISKQHFEETGYVEELKKYQPRLIILAGFLWKIPAILISAYSNRILNIHPALLPDYGGKGMYGKAVHEAGVLAKEKKSGISIHYVDEKYDHGKTIFQASCFLDENETPESLAEKIHELEHNFYPKTIDKVLGELDN